MQTVLIHRPYFYPDIEIETNSPNFVKVLGQMYRTFIAPQSSSEETLKVRVEFKGQTAVLNYGGKERETDNPLQEICGILFDNIHTQDDIFAMHAAAVAYRDKAVLMTAPTGTGKTTLTAYLVQKGFDYISDDSALIQKDDLSVLSFPHDIHLREGGIEVLRQCGVYPGGAERLRLGSVDRFIFTPTNALSGKVELGYILFIERSGENACQEVTTAERMMELMKSPMTPYTVNRNYLDFLRRLSSVPCMKITYWDMNYVADFLKENLT